MDARAHRVKRWSCHICAKTVSRLEAAAAAILNGDGEVVVRYRVLGSCRDHQADVLEQIQDAFKQPLLLMISHVRVDDLGGWAAQSRTRLLAAATRPTSCVLLRPTPRAEVPPGDEPHLSATRRRQIPASESTRPVRADSAQ